MIDVRDFNIIPDPGILDVLISGRLSENYNPDNFRVVPKHGRSNKYEI